MKKLLMTVSLCCAAGVASANDWTGFYLGVFAGQTDWEITGSPSTTTTDYGAFAGYNYDFGQFVLGGEIIYGHLDPDPGTAAHQWTGLLRAGYDAGKVLPYVALGYSDLETSNGATVDGMAYGLGMDFAATDNFRIGALLMISNLDVTGGSFDGTAFQLRAAYAF